MHTFYTNVMIAAPVERVWAVLTELERWSDWTPSIRSIERLSPGPLGVDSRVRVRQPGLLPAVWRVTDYRDRKRFTWVSHSPGTRVTASHRVLPAKNGSQVELIMEFRGVLGRLISRVARPLINYFLSLEISGLKTHCERSTIAMPANAA
jgi:uncharacterized membrane protein